ncbi:MAG: acetyl esterase [Pseudonocardiales bacterium]|nr:acetyl esterase [Pseudonocardiales bacterium]
MTADATADASRVELPGRLGDPERTLGADRRADPRLVAALAPFGLDGEQPAPTVSPSSDRADLLAFGQGAEDGFGAVFAALFAGLPPVEGVTRETVTINGADGNDILLFVHRPSGVDGELPAVVHLHGGGGVILRAADECYVRWRDELAASGLVVVGVEFRNAAGALGSHPYPAGLTDCATGARWVSAHRLELGVGPVVVSGESGGGNLSLAVALKAKREGWLGEIDGIYAMAPMISSPWDKAAELPSRQENDGYFISCALLTLMGALYDPDGAHAGDATCWPARASDAELTGLPPHVISVNELDPLRDEGLAYQRRLVANGVSAVGRTVNGTVHGGDVFFRAAMPDVYAATIRDIHSFAAQFHRGRRTP